MNVNLTDADLALIVASVVMALALVRLSLTASRADPTAPDRLVAELALAVGFLVLASLAVTQEPGAALTMLALGFAGHAAVDLLHGAGALPSDALPDWYSTACAIYDVGIAGVCYLPMVRRG